MTAEIVQSSHPAMQGVQPFTTWDETVTFTKQNTTDRTVLMERVDGTGRTPWTWVRNQGKGACPTPHTGTISAPGTTMVSRRSSSARLWECARAGARRAPAAGDPAGELRRRDERSELRES